MKQGILPGLPGFLFINPSMIVEQSLFFKSARDPMHCFMACVQLFDGVHSDHVLRNEQKRYSRKATNPCRAVCRVMSLFFFYYWRQKRVENWQKRVK